MYKKIILLAIILLISCVLPVWADTATPIRDDGQLKYSILGSTTTSYSLRPWGHAVFFQNNEPIVVNGVRLYAYRYGDLDGNVRIEIWDENLKTLYKDQIPYEKLPLHRAMSDASDARQVISWQNIPVPDHLVTGNFYLVIFTDSYAPTENKHGISIGYTKPSTSSTSHTVKSNPNRIDELALNMRGESYPPTEVDWMIRVLYKEPVATTTTQQTTPVKETVQPVTTVVSVTAPSEANTGSLGNVPASAPPAPTQTPVEIPVLVLAIVISVCILKRAD
ncbi:MAG: hypothetical protein OS112_04535 [Methanoregula sp.]|nr:MAG: hypothetical protein OS112_04535 [Methanoregula sp.]